MANYWMARGAAKTATGSLDTWFDGTYAGYTKGIDYAYIGIEATGDLTGSFWASGSDNDVNDRDAQMYTPYPTGTEIGKLYFITPEMFNDDSLATLPAPKDAFASLLFDPNDPGYHILTPSSVGFHLYSFANIDELWTEGWRILNSTEVDPLNKGNWDSMINSGDWGAVGLGSGSSTPLKEQTIACTLAYTPQAAQIAAGLGLTGGNRLKGAILLGTDGNDGGADWTKTNYIVPFNDSDVNP